MEEGSVQYFITMVNVY